MLEGVRKHWDILRESWARENEQSKGRRFIDEKDFLPAAVEILETPASPVGRLTIWGIVLFFLIALAWAIFGHVDMVVTSPGRLIPLDRVKVIQPAEIGVVRAIHVTDGQQVEAGDILIELDPTISGAEVEQVERALQVAKINALRSEALLSYLDGGPADFAYPGDLERSTAVMQQRLIASRIAGSEAALAALQRQRDERIAEGAVVDQELSRLEETLPLIKEQIDAREELVEKGYSPRLEYLELRERYVSHLKNIDIQHEQQIRVAASVATVDQQIEQARQEFRGALLTELAEATDQISLQEQERAKVRQRQGMQRLTAPVDGIVQQLAIHTVGGVVQPAEALMVIVPSTRTLVVEAMVLNKDIGSVQIGDAVEVKLEAFPFTKYGVIHGELTNLSLDAIQDENFGLIYQALVSLEKEWIRVEERDVPLAPGMAATAEIKTGERRLIEFFLSPLMRYKDESLRER